MSEPVSPEAAQAAVVGQLGAQAADLAPPATQVPVGGQAQSVDVAALLARLADVEAQVKQANDAAAAAQAATVPKPPVLADVAVNVADAAARHAFGLVGEEISRILAHIGL